MNAPSTMVVVLAYMIAGILREMRMRRRLNEMQRRIDRLEEAVRSTPFIRYKEEQR